MTTPVCPLRPLTSPTFEAFLAAALQVQNIPDDDAALILARLQAQRDNIQALVDSVRIPRQIVAEIPIFSDTLIDFESSVKDIEVRFEAVPGVPVRQGNIVLELLMDQAKFENDTGTVDTTTTGDWIVQFVYSVYVAPRASTLAFDGLAFSLVDVRVLGQIELHLGPLNPSLGPLAAELEVRLAPFAALAMQNIVNALGGLEAGATGRLARPDVVRCMFARIGTGLATPHECPIGGMPGVHLGLIDNDTINVTYEACP